MSVAILEKVRQWIESQNLFSPEHRLLLAVSGGKDSVAMSFIIKELGYSFSIAHMNFMLRGEASNEDEAFVEALAQELQVIFHGKRVDARLESLPKESTQQTARRLRYNWFAKLSNDFNYQRTLTAHTANDNAETILYNLSKGCGLKGIIGIPPLNGQIARPLLPLSTDAVLAYLASKKLRHREDLSNASDKYARNKIRHNVLPNLESINPQLVETLLVHSKRFRNIEGFYREKIEAEKKAYWRATEEGNWLLNLDEFQHNPFAENLLAEWLIPLGFSHEAIMDVYDGAHGASTQLVNKGLSLIKDRNELLLFTELPSPFEPKTIDVFEEGELKLSQGKLGWEHIAAGNSLEFGDDNVAFLDFDSLPSTNLSIGRPKQGDEFRPFGMKGRQLLSDFTTNQKLNYTEKSNLLLLRFGSEILWVVGHRINDKFKITSKTQKILKLEWAKKTKASFPFV